MVTLTLSSAVFLFFLVTLFLFSLVHLIVDYKSLSGVKGGTVTVTHSPFRCRQDRIKAWKGSPVETDERGCWGCSLASPWEWTFPCESIFKAGVHYQDNGPTDGSSDHTGLCTLEAPSRRAALLGGRLRQRHRSEQGSRGLHEHLAGSYQIFLDHNQHFPSGDKRDETELSSHIWIVYKKTFRTNLLCICSCFFSFPLHCFVILFCWTIVLK